MGQWTPIFEQQFRRPTKQLSHWQHLQDNGGFHWFTGWDRNRFHLYQCPRWFPCENLHHWYGAPTIPHQAPNWQHYYGGLLKSHPKAKNIKIHRHDFLLAPWPRNTGTVPHILAPNKKLGGNQVNHHSPAQHRLMGSKFHHTELLINNLQPSLLQGCFKIHVDARAYTHNTRHEKTQPSPKLLACQKLPH